MIKLQFRVSNEEENAIRAAAEREGLSLSEYIRRAVLEARETEKTEQISAKLEIIEAWQRVNVSILRRIYAEQNADANAEIENILKAAGIRI